jgi:hypothetical protein
MPALQETTDRGISALIHAAIGLSPGDSKLPLVSSWLASRIQPTFSSNCCRPRARNPFRPGARPLARGGRAAN